MERYQGELLTNGGARGLLSPSTVHSYVRVVNQMLVWARDPESGVEDEVPDGKVKLPKLGRPIKGILSREEIERLEDTARTERDKLIIRVFGDTGMRVGELVRLRTEDRHGWPTSHQRRLNDSRRFAEASASGSASGPSCRH